MIINTRTMIIFKSANQYSNSPKSLTPTKLIAKIRNTKIVDQAGSGSTGFHQLIIVAAAEISI